MRLRYGTARRGLTLIEILLAIAVLVIGIVGLLPVFYAGIDKTKKSIQESASAVIFSSVKSSIVQSMRLDTYTSAEQKPPNFANWVQYYHDGVPSALFFPLPHTGFLTGTNPDPANGGAKKYELEIPRDARDAPGGGATYGSKGTEVFTLGRKESGAFPLSIPASDDEKDQIGSYQFNFMIRPTDKPHLDNVYEFVIRVYRGYRVGDADNNRDQLVQEIHFIVAGN